MSRAVPQQEGFTLIEVLVALTILSISLGVLLGGFSDTLARTRESQSEMIALSMTQSLLAQTGITGPVRIGDSAGSYANGFSWRLHVEPFGGADDQRAWPTSAVAISATTSWDRGRKSVTLTTLRLVPKAAS